MGAECGYQRSCAQNRNTNVNMSSCILVLKTVRSKWWLKYDETFHKVLQG